MEMLWISSLLKINHLHYTGYLLQKLEKQDLQSENIGIKKEREKAQRIKKYNTTLWISLPDKPGKLGEITTLLGSHSLNISSVEMKEKSKEYINFKFNLIIKDLKNFTNFISELKQKEIKFKIIRHEDNW